MQGLASGGFEAACEDNGKDINPMTGAYIPYVVEWIKEKAGDDLKLCIPKNYKDIEHVFGHRPAVWFKTTASTTKAGKAKQNVSLETLH